MILPPRFQQVRQHRLGGVDSRLEIHRKHEFPSRDAPALERLEAKPTGHIDKGINPRGAIHSRADCLRCGIRVGQIDTGDKYVRVFEFTGQLRRHSSPTEQHDRVPSCRKPTGDSPSQCAECPGDDYNPLLIVIGQLMSQVWVRCRIRYFPHSTSDRHLSLGWPENGPTSRYKMALFILSTKAYFSTGNPS
jgi:hypothetical protein